MTEALIALTVLGLGGLSLFYYDKWQKERQAYNTLNAMNACNIAECDRLRTKLNDRLRTLTDAEHTLIVNDLRRLVKAVKEMGAKYQEADESERGNLRWRCKEMADHGYLTLAEAGFWDMDKPRDEQ